MLPPNRLARIAVFCLLPPSLSAQTPVEAPQVQVLEEIVHQEEGSRIVLQRIAPPAPRPSSAPSPAPLVDTESAIPSPSKPHHLLHFSATVYDGVLAVVEWSVQQRRYRAYVNADFNDLAGISSFENTEAAYSLMFAVASDTSENLASVNAAQLQAGQAAGTLVQLPPLASFPSERSSYFLAGSPAPGHVDADCAGLEALLDYYDAHKSELKRARLARETENRAREQWLRDHPPQRKDVILQVWPINSNTYPTREGGAPR